MIIYFLGFTQLGLVQLANASQSRWTLAYEPGGARTPVSMTGGTARKSVGNGALAAGTLVLIYFIWMAFEYLSVAMVVSAIRRCGRAILRVFDVRAHRLRAMHGLGTISVLLAVFFLLNGAGASEVRSETAYIMARKGAEFVPGEAGNHVRFLLDDMSIRHLDVCTAPAFLNAQDAARLSKLLGQTGKALTIGDSGAAIDVEVDASRAVPGSVRPNTLAVHTANGTTVPPFKCDVRETWTAADGSTRSVLRTDCLIMESCAHNLVSLGKLARNEHVSTTIGAADASSFLTLRDSTRVPILNLGVLVIPSCAKAAKVALGMMARPVTQGARRVKNVAGRVVHCRGAHAGHRVLRNWYRCTSDVDERWCKAVQDEPCDACLTGNCPSVPSDRSAPVVSKPGDLVSTDTFKLGVKHVHGGQINVFGAHDHFSGVNFVCLLNCVRGGMLAA